jgi:peptidoglycan/LPS O-acetylase OafA/YrhL
LYEIDLLRIIAAVAVMVYHYGFADFAGRLTSERYAGLNVVVRYGYLGVDLFFLISGFVVLLGAFDRTPRQFVTSRITRLYPAYWVAVTCTALMLVLLGRGQVTVTPLRYAANLTMANALVDVPNIDVVYWTLWSELRFYALIFVLVCVGVTRTRVLGILWGWLALTFLLHAAVLPGPVQNLLSLVFQPDWSQYFIAGMALCLVYRFGLSFQPALILMIAYGYAAYLALGFAGNVAVRYHAALNLVVVVLVVGAAFVVMTFIALRLTGRLARPWFAVLGALTYPLYLVHDRAGAVLFSRLGGVVNRWALLGGVMVFMVGLAWAIHRYVERPFAPVLRRVVTRVLGPAMDGPQNPALPREGGGPNAGMTTHGRDLANADSNLPRPAR